MKDLFLMAVGDTFEELVGEPLDDAGIQSLLPAEATHVLLEIVLEVFEDQDQLAVGVDDLAERDDVGVRQLLEDRYFPDGSGGDALFFRLEADLLEREDLVGLLVCMADELPLAL